MKTSSILKSAAFAVLAFALVAPLEGANKRRNAGAIRKAMQQQKAKKERERKEREDKREKIQTALEAKDTNHDGSLTKEEYLTGESDKEAASKTFDRFNKNKDRALSKSELADSLGL